MIKVVTGVLQIRAKISEYSDSATEAFLVAIAIAAGIGVVLSMSIGLSGGM